MIKAKKTNRPMFVIMILSPIPIFFDLISYNCVNVNNKTSKEFTILKKPQDNKWRAPKKFDKMNQDLI